VAPRVSTLPFIARTVAKAYSPGGICHISPRVGGGGCDRRTIGPRCPNESSWHLGDQQACGGTTRQVRKLPLVRWIRRCTPVTARGPLLRRRSLGSKVSSTWNKMASRHHFSTASRIRTNPQWVAVKVQFPNAGSIDHLRRIFDGILHVPVNCSCRRLRRNNYASQSTPEPLSAKTVRPHRQNLRAIVQSIRPVGREVRPIQLRWIKSRVSSPRTLCMHTLTLSLPAWKEGRGKQSSVSHRTACRPSNCLRLEGPVAPPVSARRASNPGGVTHLDSSG